MRKVLLATTALVAVALSGAAQAGTTSPISLNVGGYVDSVAGFFHESAASTTSKRENNDFEVEYKLSIDAMGKAANGIEYGANIALWNGSEASALWGNAGTTANVNSAYVWLSGAFGKFLFGDERGASDLQVYAPTVGEGQIDGRYRDFVGTGTLAFFQASGIDNTEHSTKVTYYTPKVGNDTHKVQLGVSYAPQFYNYGQNVVATTTGNGTSPYRDIVEGTLQYTGSFKPVNVVASFNVTDGSGTDKVGSTLLPGTNQAEEFTAWSLGGQAAYAGFTFGASYSDLGSYNTYHGQNKDQTVFSVGGKYEFSNVGVAMNYMNGEGYANYLSLAGAATSTAAKDVNYVKDFNAYGVGATYTWFSGMSTNADAVFFDQEVADKRTKNDSYVFLISQRLAF